jgi:hypothetical protein
MPKRNLIRQRIAQINFGGRILSEAHGDIKDDTSAAKAGRDLAVKCDWNGYLIMIAAGAALEDANFHTEAAILRKMAEDL